MSQLASATIDILTRDENSQKILARLEQSLLALQAKFKNFTSNLFQGFKLPKIVPELDTSRLQFGLRNFVASFGASVGKLRADIPTVKIPISVDERTVAGAIATIGVVAARSAQPKVKIQVDDSELKRTLVALSTRQFLPKQTQLLQLKTDDVAAAEKIILAAVARVRAGIETASRIASRSMLAFGVALGLSLREAGQAEAASVRLAAVLRATGGAAGFTVGQLEKQAAQLQQTTKFSDEAVLSAQALLATFRNVRGDIFARAIRSATDLSEVLGTDLQTATRQLGIALNDPAQGLDALSRAGVRFTEQEKAIVEAAVAAGDVIGAQRVILDRIAASMGGTAAAAANTFNGRLAILKNTFSDLLEQVGGAFIPAMNRLIASLQTAIPLMQSFTKANADTIVKVLGIGAAVLGFLILLPKLIALFAALKVILVAMAALGGGVTILIGLLAIVATALVRSSVTGESFSESMYRMARAVGFFSGSVHELADAQDKLGILNNRIKEQQAVLAGTTDLDQRIALSEKLIEDLKERFRLTVKIAEKEAEQGQAPPRKPIPQVSTPKDTSIISTPKREVDDPRLQATLDQVAKLQGELDKLQAKKDATSRPLEISVKTEAAQTALKELTDSLLSEQDRALQTFTQKLGLAVSALRAQGAGWGETLKFILTQTRAFVVGVASETAGVQRAAKEFLLSGPELEQSQFESAMERHIEALRKRGASEATILDFINKAWAKFNADQAKNVGDEAKRMNDRRESLLDRLELLGKDSEEQRRIQLEHQKRDAIKEAEELGFSRERILKIEKQFNDEMNRIADEAGQRSAQIVGLTDLFNQLQVAAAKPVKEQKPQQPPGQQPPEPPKPPPLPPLPSEDLARQALEEEKKTAKNTDGIVGAVLQVRDAIANIGTGGVFQ